MSDTIDVLILDLREWLASGERSYGEVMDAWRTSCPRLPVWEDANDRGFVTTMQLNGRLSVGITPQGRAFLAQYRSSSSLEGPLFSRIIGDNHSNARLAPRNPKNATLFRVMAKAATAAARIPKPTIPP